MSEDIFEREELKEYLHQNTIKFLLNNSKMDAARAIGVDRQIVSRVAEGKKISVPNIIPFIKFFTPRSERLAVVKKVLPEMASFFSECYGQDGMEVSSKNLNALIKSNPLYHKVFSYADYQGGTTREHIHSLYNEEGLDCLDDLVLNELIYIDPENRYRSNEGVLSCLDADAILIKINSQNTSFDKNALVDNQIGQLTYVTGTTSILGLKFLRLFAFFNATLIKSIRSIPWFKGDISYFYTSTCGTFNKHECKKINLEEYKKANINTSELIQKFIAKGKIK